MSPMRKTITAAIAVLLIASCQQETSSEPVSVPEQTSTVATTSSTTTTVPDPTTTTTAAPTSTTAATTTTATVVPPPDADPFPPEEILGTWRNGPPYITFYEDGTLELREEPDASPLERGTWEIDGAVLSLMSDPGSSCEPEEVGRYWIRWTEDRSRVLATTIEDDCGVRNRYVPTGFLPVTED